MLTVDSTAAAYLIQVYHDVALGPSAAHDVLQHQGEEQTSGLRHVQVVGVVLVPVLNRCHHLVIISADNLQVLNTQQSLAERGLMKRFLRTQRRAKSVSQHREYDITLSGSAVITSRMFRATQQK